MTTLTVTIKKKKLEKKFVDYAKKRFHGNTNRAAVSLLEKAIESVEEPNPSDNNVDLKDFTFVGMWADREDMKDSVEWVNKLREKENNRSLH